LEQLENLEHTLYLLDEEKKWIRNEVDRQVNDKLRPMRIRFYLVIAAVIIGSSLGLFFVSQQADKIADIQHRSLHEAYARCVQGNSSRDGTRKTFHDLITIATTPPPDSPPLTRKQKIRTQAFIDNVNAAIKKNIPNVDCGGIKEQANGG
jgi:hypothetical protein